MDMSIEERQKEFLRILEYGYRKGNSTEIVTTKELIQELSEQLKIMFDKTSNQSIMK